MIVCVCPNPALDVTYEVGTLARGATHRVRAVHREAGGKAVNTARVLAQLGEAVTLVVPLGDEARPWFDAAAADAGVTLVRVRIGGRTRSTVAVVDDGEATLFAEPGPLLSGAEWSALVAAVGEVAAGSAAVVLSGSLPGLPAGRGYRDLVAAAGPQRTVLDAGAGALAAALAATPAVVAPNLAEARAAAGSDPAADTDAASLARRLVQAGAGAAVVSCGPDGLVAATPDGTFRAAPPEPVAGNPTGAGDALNAALARGLATGRPWAVTLGDAVATSAAAAAARTAHRIDVEVRDRFAGAAVVEEVTGAARANR